MPTQSTPRRALLASAALGAALWLAGCAGLAPQTPEAIVEQRADARWAYLIDGDFEKAWEFTQPGFRAVVKRERYHRRFGAGATWTGMQVHEVKCEAERCNVRLRVSAKVQTPPFRNQEVVTYIEEVWVREDGQWWFYQAF
ncbi:MAG: hypothetical protein QM772_07985 [Ottowia sp.]|uniref:hypothetical protein n=1 Tax=Ottowia sp. TaxID=1898956 RepID=UPI0039E30DCE